MTLDRHNPDRDVTPAFISGVEAWLASAGEVFVILRYLHAAGAKDYAFCRTVQEFRSLVNAAPRGADIEVFRQPQLSFRGIVTDAFIADALRLIPDGVEFMLVTLQREPCSVLSMYGTFGDHHQDLRESLESLVGQEVALGLCPDFCAADGPDLISASKGGIDGPR